MWQMNSILSKLKLRNAAIIRKVKANRGIKKKERTKIMKNTEIIGIDHGWSHIKTRNTVFTSGIEENVSPTFYDNILEYNGRYFNVGGKRIEVKNTKVENEDFYLLTLAALAKEFNNRRITESDVYISAGLPLTRFGEEKQTFIEYLQKNRDISFKYNQKEYKAHIERVSVFPQCYSAVADMIPTFPRKVVVIDVGSWTVDIMPVINKRPDDQRCESLPHGIITCIKDINRACIKKFNYELDENDMEHYIRHQQLNEVPKEVVKLMDKFFREYTEAIIRSLKEHDINIQTTPIVFVGGGATVIKNHMPVELPNIKFKTDIKANAKGYETLAKMAAKERCK